jgi:hypothetical protein
MNKKPNEGLLAAADKMQKNEVPAADPRPPVFEEDGIHFINSGILNSGEKPGELNIDFLNLVESVVKR